MFVRNVRPLWIMGSQKAVEWGEPESDFISFQALAGLGLLSRSATKFQLFTTCIARLVSVPQRGVGIEVTAQVAHLLVSKIERVRDASGSVGGRVDVVDCGSFPTGELDLDCEAF